MGAFYKLGMVSWKIVSKLTYLLDSSEEEVDTIKPRINTKTTPQRADHTDIIQYTKHTEIVKYKHIMTLMKLHGITLTRE